jgi:hypothetical protein
VGPRLSADHIEAGDADLSSLGSFRGKQRTVPRHRVEPYLVPTTSNSRRTMRAREVSRRDSIIVFASMAFLAVTFGELMTGGIAATPFSLLGVFFIPPFVLVGLTYGLGVLLVREASVRLQRGWAGTLLLAGANVWILQGIFTKVLFGPASSPDIGPLGSYGHWLGVNWILVVVAIYMDAILATIFPIFLTGECFPQVRGRRILSDWGVAVAAAALLLVAAIDDVYVNANNDILPSAAHPFVSALGAPDLAWVALVIGGVGLLAWKIPRDILRPLTPLPPGSPWEMVGVGLAFTISSLFVEGFAWHYIPWPVAIVAGYALFSGFLLWLIRQRIGRSATLQHRAALVAGVLAPWLLFDSVLEIHGDLLVLPIALAVFAILAWLWMRGRAEEAPGPQGLPTTR